MSNLFQFLAEVMGPLVGCALAAQRGATSPLASACEVGAALCRDDCPNRGIKPLQRSRDNGHMVLRVVLANAPEFAPGIFTS